MKNILAFAVVLLFAAFTSAQTAPIKIRVAYDVTSADSSAVVPLLIQMLAGQPKFFTVVKGDEKNAFVIADCLRLTASDPYSCFCTAEK